MEFFDNFERAHRSWKFTADRVCNIDETGVSKVVLSPNIVAQIGMQQVGQAVSGERETMIAVCLIISSVDNTVPLAFIFPRARLHDSRSIGAPPGSLGLVNSPQSIWMTGHLHVFLKDLEHAKKHTRIFKEHPIILLMDNHENYCTLANFLPHCSHRLQPLDVGVMRRFIGKLRVAQNDWMTANQGKVITVITWLY
jgi:hypothetical protein